MSIGIPYAPAKLTLTGLIRTCPVCGKKIFESWDEFDETGEYRSKDAEEPIPSPYQMHYMVEHG